jgi:hypothetical protein
LDERRVDRLVAVAGGELEDAVVAEARIRIARRGERERHGDQRYDETGDRRSLTAPCECTGAPGCNVPR